MTLVDIPTEWIGEPVEVIWYETRPGRTREDHKLGILTAINPDDIRLHSEWSPDESHLAAINEFLITRDAILRVRLLAPVEAR